MNAIHSPQDLLFDQLRDLFSATGQMVETLPDLAGWASSSDLRRLFNIHRNEAEEQRAILGGLCERRGVDPAGDVCQAIKGLVEGGNAHLEMADDGKVRDLMLVAHFARIKHYQIAGTRFSASLADCLEFDAEAGELWHLAKRHGELLEELAQVGANFFSPCLLESGSL